MKGKFPNCPVILITSPAIYAVLFFANIGRIPMCPYFSHISSLTGHSIIKHTGMNVAVYGVKSFYTLVGIFSCGLQGVWQSIEDSTLVLEYKRKNVWQKLSAN